MKQLHCVFFMLLTSIGLKANDKVERYIQQFAPIAMQEMDRMGIPASIKLAQGLLESSWGQSELARVGNNHFGIKCSDSWDGETFYKKDDDRNADGKLIESCFRVYTDPSSSYIAHSEFLTQKRYSNLFTYAPDDYMSWAYGLKEAGYATDPSYPQKLINIIEKYNLHQFDEPVHQIVLEPGLSKTEQAQILRNEMEFERNRELAEAQRRQSKYEVIEEEQIAEPQKEDSQTESIGDQIADSYSSIRSKAQNTYQGARSKILNESSTNYRPELSDNFDRHNGVKMYFTNGGETPRDIAEKYDIPVRDIVNNTDNIYDADQILPSRQRVYFEKKNKQYQGREKYHRVRHGQTMEDIADHYAIDLEMLYLRNRLPTKAQPKAGQMVQLSGLVNLGKRPAYKIVEREEEMNENVVDKIEYLFDGKSLTSMRDE